MFQNVPKTLTGPDSQLNPMRWGGRAGCTDEDVAAVLFLSHRLLLRRKALSE
jgi:hypothetical protein